MAPRRTDDGQLPAKAAARVAEVASTMGTTLTDLAGRLHAELADSIPELRGDPLILDLLRASVESNVETFLHVAQYHISIDEVSAPSAAVEYARRLAQRGISSNALLRAYHLGQRRVLDWAMTEIAQTESDGDVAMAAAQVLQTSTFAYIDRVSEQVVAEYEIELESWLANRNSVRATMLAAILAGEQVDSAAAESALGYRLRQHHLGLVVWSSESDSSMSQLRRLETLVGAIGGAIGGAGQPLFIPRDGALGWGWIPLGRTVPQTGIGQIAEIVADAGQTVRVALGTPAAALPGFRDSHLQALRAYAVASVAADRAEHATTYADPGVRAAALLVGDLDSARELVATSLGGLAADDEQAERLRDTLSTFLGENRSYVATAERIHLHKNTVKYRVDKAIELRGRALDDDRFNLELALLACRWLGRTVLSR